MPEGEDEDEWKAKIDVGSRIVTWVLTILEDVLTDGTNFSIKILNLRRRLTFHIEYADKAAFPAEGVLPIASIILALAPSSTSPVLPLPEWSAEDASDNIDTDLELLTTASNLLESITMDLDPTKLHIAFGIYTPPSATLFSLLLAFVESGELPQRWAGLTDDEKAMDKAFAGVKSGVVKTVVEAPNSDEVMNRLFASGAEPGQSEVVRRFVGWIEEDRPGREDLLICAAHALAALGRKDEHCISLVRDYGLALPLAKIAKGKAKQQFDKAEGARPGEVTQILFGVVSLLRHLAIPIGNKSVLGETEVVGSVATLLQRQLDVVGPLQNAVVGLLKHLTANNGQSRWGNGGVVEHRDTDLCVMVLCSGELVASAGSINSACLV